MPEYGCRRGRTGKLLLTGKQALICLFIFRNRRKISTLRRQMLFQHILKHIAVKKHLISRCGHYHHIHIRINENILAQHPVECKLPGSFTGPDLIAVARKTGIFRRNYFRGNRLSHPVLRNELLPLPFSGIQIQLPQLGHILHTEKQTPAALIISLWTGFPEDFFDPHGAKKSGG